MSILNNFRYNNYRIHTVGESIKKRAMLYFISFIAGLINGLLGSGGGVILVTSLVFLFKLHDHKAHATTISIILPLTIISSFIYLKAGFIPIQISIYVTLGTILGAYIGSRMLNRLSVNIIRKVFGILMIIAAIGMMY